MLSPRLQQIGRAHIRWNNRKLLYFGGCDYFRLSRHPAVMEGLQSGLEKYGLNVAASRTTTGNHEVYELLEERLARFFGGERALLLPNGYAANLALGQGLAGAFSHAFIDEYAHGSLQDAASFLDCLVLKYKHADAQDFARILEKCGRVRRAVLLTDGMFAATGELAPLASLLKYLPRDGLLVVDDSHAAGVLGLKGQGSLEQAGCRRDRCIQTLTLSKCFGVYGGAIVGPAKVRDLVVRSRLFVGSTPLPLPLAYAALQSMVLLEMWGQHWRQELMTNALYVRTALRQQGYDCGRSEANVIAIVPRNEAHRARLEECLLEHGVYPSFVKYAGGAGGEEFLRLAVSSEHNRTHLNALVKALAAAARGRKTKGSPAA